MGALPKKKLSSSRRRKRMATKKYTASILIKCSNCGKLKQSHIVCPHCGYYKEKQIIKKKETVKVTKIDKEKE